MTSEYFGGWMVALSTGDAQPSPAGSEGGRPIRGVGGGGIESSLSGIHCVQDSLFWDPSLVRSPRPLSNG